MAGATREIEEASEMDNTDNIRRILSYGSMPHPSSRIIVASHILPDEASSLLTQRLAGQIIVYYQGCNPSIKTEQVPQELWYEQRSVLQDIETSDGTLYMVFQKDHSDEVLERILRKILGMIKNKLECAIVIICNSTIPDFIKDSEYIRCTYTTKGVSYVLLRP